YLLNAAEYLYQIMLTSCHHSKFGIAFCEASAHCLIRVEGNDDSLKKTAAETARSLGAGHTFVILMRDAYPINVLNAVKACPEVCQIYCATANPVQVIAVETDQGRGVLGVVDVFSPKGVEGEAEAKAR